MSRKMCTGAVATMAVLCASCSGPRVIVKRENPVAKRENPVVGRAAFELDCPKSELRWHDLGNRAWGVRGCGRQATYVQECQQDLNEDAARWGFVDLETKCRYVLRHIGEGPDDSATASSQRDGAGRR